MKEDKERNKITFKYVIPEHIQDLYINGAYGGVGHAGSLIYMHVYSERRPIPKALTHALTDERRLGEELERKIGGDMIRLVQASLVMNIETARAIRDWLDEKIIYLEGLKNEQPE